MCLMLKKINSSGCCSVRDSLSFQGHGMRLNQEEREKKVHGRTVQTSHGASAGNECTVYVCVSQSETDQQSANRNPDNVTRLISM